jgi:Flp pilus assembly protein TadG
MQERFVISWFPTRSSDPSTAAHWPQDAKREDGQELVEFALILPLLLLLCFGIIEVGRLMLSYNTVANAAREGARHGIVDPNQGNIRTAALRLTAGVVCSGGSPPTVSFPAPPAGTIQVTVSCQFQTVIGNFIPALADVKLSSTATMQKE